MRYFQQNANARTTYIYRDRQCGQAVPICELSVIAQPATILCLFSSFSFVSFEETRDC